MSRCKAGAESRERTPYSDVRGASGGAPTPQMGVFQRPASAVRVGIGYRRALSAWILSRPAEIEFVELTAEHFFDGDAARLRELAGSYPTAVHGLGLSLGTPGALDADSLDRFCRVVEIAQPEWVSEHAAFTRTADVDLGHLNPVPCTRASLDVLSAHAREVMARCGRPLIFENIATFVRPDGDFSEPEFLNRLCEKSGAGLLLDVTNLVVNARNFNFSARAWLDDLDLARVVQLHVVGYTKRGGRWHDHHAEAIQDDLYELTAHVVAKSAVKAIVIERDVDWPHPSALARELARLKGMLGAH